MAVFPAIAWVRLPLAGRRQTAHLPDGFTIVYHIDHAYLLGHGNPLETDSVFGSVSSRANEHLAVRIEESGVDVYWTLVLHKGEVSGEGEQVISNRVIGSD